MKSDDPAAHRQRDISFSTLSPSILERENRLRVGRQILAVLEDFLNSQGLGTRRILDVGCSSGVIASLLADVSGSVIGVDIDEKALRIAREESKRPNLEFVEMSGADLRFPPESFDIVICNQVYYWFDDPGRLMAEIERVLKPGGCCFLASVNRYTLMEKQYRVPFLSFLPKRLADMAVRAAGKGDRFGCSYLSFWGLRRLCRNFIIHRYTAKVLKDPAKYKFTRLSAIGAITRVLPVGIVETLEPFSPNFVWVLEKPRP